MADNKKYYYMRLKENFFDDESMKLLEAMPDGYLYSNILLKMYLSSLKTEGRLMMNGIIPYSPEMIAAITRHQVGTVEKALEIFQTMGLIDVLDNGAIYMLNIQNFIGKSSTEADRIRDYQRKIAEEKNGKVEIYKKSTPEIEIETEIETEKDNIATFFSSCWSQYPRKLGKGKVSDKQKRKLFNEVGEEQMLRCIERYKDSCVGKDEQYIMYGSTFFNSGYVDFLDENVSVPTPKGGDSKWQTL